MSKQLPTHVLFNTIKETEALFSAGAPAFERLHRSRLDYDRRALLEQALRAYRLNPLARRIIKLYRYFSIGTNVSVEVKGQPGSLFRRMRTADKLRHTQRFVQEFWQHPLNRLDEQIPEWFDERSLTGELFLLFSADAAGMALVRAVPSESIVRIDTAENDTRQEICFHTGEIDDKAYPGFMYGADAPWRADAVRPTMKHYVINRPVGSTWGESDLFPLLPWLSRYTGWLENRAVLNYWRQVFVWAIKGKYASREERLARQKELEARPPQPGSIMVGDETETWEAISPKLDAFEAGADGLALKKQIAAGAGIPLHYLAEPETSTRTTAEAAGTPTFKNFADYQASFFNILRDVVQTACAIRRQVDDHILPQPEIDIHGQDISERDNAGLALAFQRAVEASGELYDRKMISTKEMLRTAYQFGGLVFDETENPPEGLRRPLSNRVKPRTSTPPPTPSDPETDEQHA